MPRLAHSYTNDTSREGDVVTKRYAGPDAVLRCAREVAAVRAGQGRLPVPEPVDGGEDWQSFTFMPGVHGQELIAAGLAAEVFRSCGDVLRRIHEVDPAGIFDDRPVPPGARFVHGDFGPNNILFTPDATSATAVLDWEWARIDDPIVDLAWCEWIARMYHAEHLDAFEGFFTAYGSRPPWEERHAAMVEQCRALVDFWERWRPGEDITAHRRRQLADTEAWAE